ncbi:MAG: lysophospholipid acyltransferase family protein [Pyrinomonadaceae bacterium]
MKYVRAIIRTLALIGVSAGYYLRWSCGRLWVAGSRQRALDWRNRSFRGWARTSARVIGMTINSRNQPPAGPFLLVANHLSYVDVIALAAQLDCAFVAKSEVATWPFIGALCRKMDTIFIDRRSKRDLQRALAQIDQTRASGLGVVLFAEGTSSDGTAVLPFKASLLATAARAGVPVHYASVGYVAPVGEIPAGRSVCWWGDMTFLDHLFRLLQLPSFSAKLVYGPEPIIDRDRRVLAADLRSAVSAQLTFAGGLA